MVSNEEISIRLESKRRGLDPNILIDGLDFREILQIMQVPYEWTGNSYLFDFDSMPIEELSHYIYYIFKQDGYRLDEGTLTDGIYLSLRLAVILFIGFWVPPYKFRVEIYFNEGKTYLEISKVFHGFYISLNKIIYGKNYPNSELNRIANKIKYLKPSSMGILICNKCGSYYELQEGESPDDFDKKCECGGTLGYIGRDQPDKERVEKNMTDNIIQTIAQYLYNTIIIIYSIVILLVIASFFIHLIINILY